MLLTTKPHGFTLIELMVTIAVAAVLLGIAVPSMRNFIRNNRLTSDADSLMRSFQVARTEAIKQHQHVVVCASADATVGNATPTCVGGGGSYATGWIVFADIDQSGQENTGDIVIEKHDALDTSITVKNDSNGFTDFNSAGSVSDTPAPTLKITLCDDRGTASVDSTNSAARAIVIDKTGHSRVSRTITDVGNSVGCP
jgi:type IV fimbrial biogenesis protein FimT